MSAMPPSVPPSSPPPTGGGSYTPPPPPGGYPPPGGSSSDRTLMLVLSYIGLLALSPLLLKKDDREVQWHAKNGLALLVAELVVWVVFWIIGYAMRSTVLGCGLATIQCAVWLGFLVVRILAIVKGVGGQRFRIPVVSDFADKM